MDPVESFSENYQEARQKFLAASVSAGFQVENHQHPLRGPDGKKLYMDVARKGPADADKALLVMSATHGLEGFCGSGVQTFGLNTGTYDPYTDDIAIVHIHAINPYGFAWLSRSNEECVDICRNFVDFNAPLPHNTAYDELIDLLVPSDWQGKAREDADAALAAYIKKHGMRNATSDIATGQYKYWYGTFYGGQAPSWSRRMFLAVVKQHLSRADHVACVDYHSGLGPYGYGEMLVFHQPDSIGESRAKAWWGDRAKSIKGGESAAYDLKGGILDGLENALPDAELTAGALEYGTISVPEMLDAIRADQWLRYHGDLHSDLAGQIRKQILHAFYCNEPEWKKMIIEQGILVQKQALNGLKAV